MRIKVPLYIQAVKGSWEKVHRLSVQTISRQQTSTLSTSDIKQIDVWIDVPELDGYDFNALSFTKLEEEKECIMREAQAQIDAVDLKIKNNVLAGDK